tara:strand:+ start:79 stop:735 length:657 start_codon:yes stop_codon:yes gene_type:complete
MINLHNKDCMLALKEFEDKQFDLAIVDPPYRDAKDNTPVRGMRNKNDGTMLNFGNAPTKKYFDELFRVSKNQIVWGANYFPDIWSYKINKLNRGCKGFIFWLKNNPVDNFSDGELAWTSFEKTAKCYNFNYYGNLQGNKKSCEKIHATQKPYELYEWLLMNYAKEGDKILDTHLGSGSIAIACHNLGFDLEGYELDKEYFEAASKRLKQHQQQIRMFK